MRRLEVLPVTVELLRDVWTITEQEVAGGMAGVMRLGDWVAARETWVSGMAGQLCLLCVVDEAPVGWIALIWRDGWYEVHVCRWPGSRIHARTCLRLWELAVAWCGDCSVVAYIPVDKPEVARLAAFTGFIDEGDTCYGRRWTQRSGPATETTEDGDGGG